MPVKTYIRNPDTNRWIQVNGTTYKRLLVKYPNLANQPTTQRESPTARPYPVVSAGHERDMLGLEVDPRSLAESHRWGPIAPKRGPARRLLYSTCGAKCFFQPKPDDQGQSGYPICASGESCIIDCKGARAAYAFARRYDRELARRIRRLQRVKCGVTDD